MSSNMALHAAIAGLTKCIVYYSPEKATQVSYAKIRLPSKRTDSIFELEISLMQK